MSIRKDQLFTLTASLDIIKKAVRQVVPDLKKQNGETIIFNSLMQALEKKSASSKGEQKK